MTTHKPVTEADRRETIREAIHRTVCDARSSHDAALGRCSVAADAAAMDLAALPEPEPTAREDGADPDRLAAMAVMSLGEFTTLPEYERIHQKFRASFAARLRRAAEYRAGKSCETPTRA